MFPVSSAPPPPPPVIMIPQPYDGKRKGVPGVCEALMHISRQLDFLIKIQLRNDNG